MTAAANALEAALGFTEADLEANRRGKLSPAQIMRIKRRRKRTAMVGALLFVCLTLGATLLFYLGQQNRSLILHAAGAMLTVINALLAARAGRAYLRVGGDLKTGGVDVVAGAVERVLRPGRGPGNYVLRIAGVDMVVSRAVFVGFEHLAAYRVYRSAVSRVLLSAEAAS